jgi:hypothetical protein
LHWRFYQGAAIALGGWAGWGVSVVGAVSLLSYSDFGGF